MMLQWATKFDAHLKTNDDGFVHHPLVEKFKQDMTKLQQFVPRMNDARWAVQQEQQKSEGKNLQKHRMLCAFAQAWEDQLLQAAETWCTENGFTVTGLFFDGWTCRGLIPEDKLPELEAALDTALAKLLRYAGNRMPEPTMKVTMEHYG